MWKPRAPSPGTTRAGPAPAWHIKSALHWPAWPKTETSPLAQYLLGMDQENLPLTTPPPPSYRYRDAGVIQPPKYMYRVSHITSVLGSLYSITQYTINVCLISCPHTIGPTWQVRNINVSTALTHIILVRATAPFQCQHCWRYFLFVIFLLANFNIIRCNHKTVK